MIWDEFLRHFRFCDEEDSGLSDEEQEQKGPKNRPKHTRKRIHQAKKNFLEKFKTASHQNHKKNVEKIPDDFFNAFFCTARFYLFQHKSQFTCFIFFFFNLVFSQ
ncbi:hypothetical protein [Bacteroides sp. An279]|uniref:hypothetical protein n=2 Tax=Bacteroides TaxID=816 RepID=UPI0013A600D8|nr:hypothetical protein [Bacteroides sp. An279]